MNTIFLAGVLDDDPIPGFSGMSSTMKERVIVLGAVLLVIAIALAWVYFSRRKRRHLARREERHRRRHSFAKNAGKSFTELKEYVQEHQRGRRRRHRPRNPTLAETGGLPPMRPDAPAPPTSPP